MNRHALTTIAALAGLFVCRPAWAGNPLFDLIPDALDPQACGGSGCWTNHLRVTDIDGDDDLDLLLANYSDFFGGSNDPEPLVVYTNDGSANFTNTSAAAVGGYTGNLRMIAVGDVDGDGAVDVFAPQGNGGPYVLFMNDGSGVFTDEADMRLPAGDYPAGAAARMGDVDGDGDLDIFSADAYASGGPPYGRLYINDGLGNFEEAMGAIPGSISGVDIDDVEFLDVDRDFDLDLFVNAHNGGTGALWLNDGTGTFAAGPSVSPPGNNGNHYNAAPCDVDGDGDLDMWIDNIGGGYTEQLLINDGSGNLTDETAARVSGNPGADDNGVICADIDDDGDFDGVVITLSGTERLLENDGTGNFTYVPGIFPPPGNCSLWGEFGDLNGDGRFDLITGQGECSSSDEVYLANQFLPPDSLPPKIIAVEDPSPVAAGVEPAVRFAVSDRTVTDEGPRLDRAFIVVDPDGAGTIIDATFMGGDLFRAVLPAGNDGELVTYQACAEDRNANLACSDPQVYEVGGEPPGGTDSSGGAVDSSGGGPDTDDGVDSATIGTMTTMTTMTASATVTASAGDAGEDTETDSAGGADDGDGGGCGCRQSSSGGAAWSLLLLGLLAINRRRGRG
ncbi:FG-GAP repeat domain-containing protein [Paraliomyxa miuraensis]|uniref:FG-GAP repeat domain-containing protein n=1 Tax=Paraliomyxa miuraensis TaxID=376150 RepID=UPI00225B94A3|nr:VCBS repeat-containing protein [Paraliomyxa miuraensis]MCX4246096.1 VCBS repeat-containing protein [Paraliomyxa miuraensis]